MQDLNTQDRQLKSCVHGSLCIESKNFLHAELGLWIGVKMRTADRGRKVGGVRLGNQIFAHIYCTLFRLFYAKNLLSGMLAYS